MGELRDRMAVDLRLRGMSPVTQRMYLGCAERFVAFHRRSPKELGETEIRAFLNHLVREKRVARSTHAVSVAAIQFLYQTTLDRPGNVTESSVTFTLTDRLYRCYHADSLGIAIALYHVRCQTYEAANVWFTRDGSQFEAPEEVV